MKGEKRRQEGRKKLKEKENEGRRKEGMKEVTQRGTK